MMKNNISVLLWLISEIDKHFNLEKHSTTVTTQTNNNTKLLKKVITF